MLTEHAIAVLNMPDRSMTMIKFLKRLFAGILTILALLFCALMSWLSSKYLIISIVGVGLTTILLFNVFYKAIK